MMGNKRPRILLAASKSGSGKTALTCGLLQALLERGLRCASFKCGPDYIDPMFHKYVLGIDGGNLDSYFLDKAAVRREMADLSAGADISIIEGVMGYYDGIGGNTTQASSYEVACVTDTPAVLILDCRGASLTLTAIAGGLYKFRDDSHIQGVILNRISQTMAECLKPQFEAIGLPVYGYLPECDEAKLDGRHLGLVTPGEAPHLHSQLKKLASRMEQTVDIDRLLALAQTASPIEEEEKPVLSDTPKEMYSVQIGVARDQAFCFYYQENLKLLENYGARLVFFSPLKDSRLPDEIDGLLLGGGYPELYAEELSKNRSMRENIKKMVREGLPTLAECGGFLYLHKWLEGQDGKRYPMAGAIAAEAYKYKLSRFGYIGLEPGEDSVWLKKGEVIKGHEFHYWESTDPGTAMTARKPSGNRSWECMHESDSLLAGFAHLYYPSNPGLAVKWLKLCRTWKESRKR